MSASRTGYVLASMFVFRDPLQANAVPMIPLLAKLQSDDAKGVFKTRRRSTAQDGVRES